MIIIHVILQKDIYSLQTIYLVILLSFDVLTAKFCNSVKL